MSDYIQKKGDSYFDKEGNQVGTGQVANYNQNPYDAPNWDDLSVPNKFYVLDTRQYEIAGIGGEVKVYDSVFYVDVNNGNNGTALVDDPYKPFQSIVTAWQQAYLYSLATGKKTYVHVRAGNYTERLLTFRDGVDLYFEEFAILYGEYGFIGGIIGTSSSVPSKFDILGRGSFIDTGSTNNVEGAGVRFTNGSQEFNLQAKEVSSITLWANTIPTLPFKNIIEVESIYGEFIKGVGGGNPLLEGYFTFNKCGFPRGFVSGRNRAGLDLVFNDCEFILETQTGYNVLDEDGNIFLTVANVDAYDTSALTNQQVINGVNFSFSQLKTRRLAAVDLRPVSNFGGADLQQDKYDFNNCIYRIRKENCFGLIAFQREDINAENGYLIINGGQVFDETVGNNGAALSIGKRTIITNPKYYSETLVFYNTPTFSVTKSGYLPFRNNLDSNISYTELDEVENIGGFIDNVFGVVTTNYPYKKLEIQVTVTIQNVSVFIKQIDSTNLTRGGRLDEDSVLTISVLTDEYGEFNLSSSDVANTDVKILSIE